jgi:hypothetical protein
MNLMLSPRTTARQLQALSALESLALFEVLREYAPVLAGTIPLDLDLADSDLDIICEARDLAAFERAVIGAFGAEAGFRIKREIIAGVESVIANFDYAGFPFEIFGQPRPAREQNAYRHMLVEARLLALGGERAWRALRELKRAGLKTEPAFARYFRLKGDPYATLLELSSLSAKELEQAIEVPP